MSLDRLSAMRSRLEKAAFDLDSLADEFDDARAFGTAGARARADLREGIMSIMVGLALVSSACSRFAALGETAKPQPCRRDGPTAAAEEAPDRVRLIARDGETVASDGSVAFNGSVPLS